MKGRKKNMEKITFACPMGHVLSLRKISALSDIDISKLVAIAVDNEMSKGLEGRFKVDLCLPDIDDVEEFAYAHEAGKLLDFLKVLQNGTSLMMLYILRHEIGVSDKDRLLYALSDLLQRKMVEAYRPEPTKYMIEVPEDLIYYKAKFKKERKVKTRYKKKEKSFEDLEKEYLQRKKELEESE